MSSHRCVCVRVGDGYCCEVQGLSFISAKVAGAGRPALLCYRGDSKHCYRGRPEVCARVHGEVAAEQRARHHSVLQFPL